MAETTADVRRDIEMTRERMSQTISELERKLNVLEVVREHPWPSIAVAASAGFLLAGTGADIKAAGAAAAASVAATKGAGSRVAPLFDTLIARVLNGIQEALEQRADSLVGDLKRAIGSVATAAPVAATRAASQHDDLQRPPQVSRQSSQPVTGDHRSAVGVPAPSDRSGAAFQGEARTANNSYVTRPASHRAD